MTRPERIAQFRRAAGKGGLYDTSLCPIDGPHPRTRAAILNWFTRETAAHPTCFACRACFGIERRPAAFLSAIPIRTAHAGIAIAGCCETCWSDLAPDAIEAAALACLRRQLNPNGKLHGVRP
jgi:hypothetical protein